MTSHLDSHGRTDIRPEVLSVVQTGNGIQHVEYDIQALRMCTHTEKTTFKDKEKRSNSSKKNAPAGIAYSAYTIPPLRHFLFY